MSQQFPKENENSDFEPMVRTFADAAWTAEDIKKCRPDWTVEECVAWLQAHDSRIVDVMVGAGWEYIEMWIGPRREEVS